MTERSRSNESRKALFFLRRECSDGEKEKPRLGRVASLALYGMDCSDGDYRNHYCDRFENFWHVLKEELWTKQTSF